MALDRVVDVVGPDQVLQRLCPLVRGRLDVVDRHGRELDPLRLLPPREPVPDVQRWQLKHGRHVSGGFEYMPFISRSRISFSQAGKSIG